MSSLSVKTDEFNVSVKRNVDIVTASPWKNQKRFPKPPQHQVKSRVADAPHSIGRIETETTHWSDSPITVDSIIGSVCQRRVTNLTHGIPTRPNQTGMLVPGPRNFPTHCQTGELIMGPCALTKRAPLSQMSQIAREGNYAHCQHIHIQRGRGKAQKIQTQAAIYLNLDKVGIKSLGCRLDILCTFLESTDIRTVVKIVKL